MNLKRKQFAGRSRVAFIESLEGRTFMSATALSVSYSPPTVGTTGVTEADKTPTPKTTMSDIVIVKTLDRSSPSI